MKSRALGLIYLGFVVGGFLYGWRYGPHLSPLQLGGLGLFAGVGVFWICSSLLTRYIKP